MNQVISKLTDRNIISKKFANWYKIINISQIGLDGGRKRVFHLLTWEPKLKRFSNSKYEALCYSCEGKFKLTLKPPLL